MATFPMLPRKCRYCKHYTPCDGKYVERDKDLKRFGFCDMESGGRFVYPTPVDCMMIGPHDCSDEYPTYVMVGEDFCCIHFERKTFKGRR